MLVVRRICYNNLMAFVLTRNRIIILSIGATLAVGLIFFVIFGARVLERPPQIRLTVWGVFDDKRVFENMIGAYTKSHPNVVITYVEKKYLRDEARNYEKELVDTLAAGAGPDIFMVHNTWLPKHQEKMRPLDLQLQTALTFPFVQFRDAFPKVVEQDFTRETTIYASPLFVDTLAMFYNRDFFDRKSIPLVPATWPDFERIVPQLRELEPATSNIVKAGAAIGGSEASINRATDLLSAIMMQRGTVFTSSDNTQALFAQRSGATIPALLGLEFYAQFANPNSSLYTWNERFPYSVDSFAAGDTATMFNYAHQIPAIKSKNPFLDFRIAPLPQLASATQPVNYANYWGLAVSNQSTDALWAWDFIKTITTDEAIADAYTKNTGNPPALLTLINRKLNDPELGVFARQALTARSWWQADNNAIEDIFSRMIASVIRGELSVEVALRKAQDEVSLLMRQR